MQMNIIQNTGENSDQQMGPLQERNINVMTGNSFIHDQNLMKKMNSESIKAPYNDAEMTTNSSSGLNMDSSSQNNNVVDFQNISEQSLKTQNFNLQSDIGANNQDLAFKAKINQLETQLNLQLFENLSKEELATIDKFFLVPIGLPGMGKTTLSRFLSAKSQQMPMKKMSQPAQQQAFPKIQNFSKRAMPDGPQQSSELMFEFNKISYDRILTGNQKDYCDKHPETGMHEAIDIIRPKADQDYLDAISFHCDDQSEEQGGKDPFRKQVIYLDRNNTPDVWQDIQRTILKANKSKKVKNYKTVIIVPNQHADFDPALYHTFNPICPHMMYECIKRIFGRKSHDCLSAENKPKVVEVILKFAKLYDGAQLDDDQALKKNFDQIIRLDFLHFASRSKLEQVTVDTLIDGYNNTPPNFQCPTDEVIQKCIEVVDKQIEIDNIVEGPSQSKEEYTNLLSNNS